jgi:cbb3-type cytochrome oxidase subunit 3
MTFLIEYAKIISLFFFLTVFVFIAFNAYRPSAKQKLQEHAFIPLKEDTHG